MGIFSELPLHNQKDVLKKIDFRDFVQFKQCSKETAEITQNFRHRLPLAVESIRFEESSFTFRVYMMSQIHELESIYEEPVRPVVHEFSFFERSSEQFKHFQTICQKLKLVAQFVVLSGGEYEPSLVGTVLKLLNPVGVYVQENYSAFLNELKKLKTIILINGLATDSDLLLIENPGIEICCDAVDSAAINKFLKQWQDGEREIEELKLFTPGAPLQILENLEFSLLWSPETRESSPLAHLEEELGTNGQSRNVYSLSRNDGKKIFIVYTTLRFSHVIAKEYEDLEEIEKWIQWKYSL